MNGTNGRSNFGLNMSVSCECKPDAYPFHCARHGCRKTAHWHRLCQTRPDYRSLWDVGRGPGQTLPTSKLEDQQNTTICPHRRLYPQNTVRLKGGGCRSVVSLVQCELFGEPVTCQRLREYQIPEVQDSVPEYQGRCCHACNWRSIECKTMNSCETSLKETV